MNCKKILFENDLYSYLLKIPQIDKIIEMIIYQDYYFNFIKNNILSYDNKFKFINKNKMILPIYWLFIEICEQNKLNQEIYEYFSEIDYDMLLQMIFPLNKINILSDCLKYGNELIYKLDINKDEKYYYKKISSFDHRI